MTTARDVMTKNVEIIGADATIDEAAKTMAKKDIGAMPVCDNDLLQGMLTDRDIAVKAVAKGMDPKKTKVGDIIDRREVVTIGADDSLDEAMRTMKDHKVRRLPVIDGSRVVGMVSQGDLAVSLPENKVGKLVEAISAAP